MLPDEARRMVAENIKAAARRKRMSLNRLADFSGLNRPHLLRVCAGKADATVGWLAQLADSLGVELRALFDPAILESLRSEAKAKPAPRDRGPAPVRRPAKAVARPR